MTSYSSAKVLYRNITHYPNEEFRFFVTFCDNSGKEDITSCEVLFKDRVTHNSGRIILNKFEITSQDDKVWIPFINDEAPELAFPTLQVCVDKYQVFPELCIRLSIRHNGVVTQFKTHDFLKLEDIKPLDCGVSEKLHKESRENVKSTEVVHYTPPSTSPLVLGYHLTFDECDYNRVTSFKLAYREQVGELIKWVQMSYLGSRDAVDGEGHICPRAQLLTGFGFSQFVRSKIERQLGHPYFRFFISIISGTRAHTFDSYPPLSINPVAEKISAEKSVCDDPAAETSDTRLSYIESHVAGIEGYRVAIDDRTKRITSFSAIVTTEKGSQEVKLQMETMKACDYTAPRAHVVRQTGTYKTRTELSVLFYDCVFQPNLNLEMYIHANGYEYRFFYSTLKPGDSSKGRGTFEIMRKVKAELAIEKQLASLATEKILSLPDDILATKEMPPLPDDILTDEEFAPLGCSYEDKLYRSPDSNWAILPLKNHEGDPAGFSLIDVANKKRYEIKHHLTTNQSPVCYMWTNKFGPAPFSKPEVNKLDASIMIATYKSNEGHILYYMHQPPKW